MTEFEQDQAFFWITVICIISAMVLLFTLTGCSGRQEPERPPGRVSPYEQICRGVGKC